MENKKPDQKPEPTAQNKPSQPQKSNSALIIILIVVVAVIVLAGLVAGGWFAWKHWIKKNTGTTTSETNKNSNTSASSTTNSNVNSNLNSNANRNTNTAIGDYIIADSDTRLISVSELYSLTPWQLKVARNEIYARHGRAFVHKDLQCYFAKKSWYTTDPNYTETSLSNIENKNVATILNYEQATNSPLLSTDSGCNSN